MTATLEEVLEQAKVLGFLGPGPVEAHVSHAQGFEVAWDGPPPEHAADLGSGGGVPALVLALRWPGSRWALVESAARRCAHLRWAIEELGIADRVRVLQERAELAARGPLRGTCDLVTARSFAPPAVTAECAAPLLRLNGVLVVSEPPDGGSRWDRQELRELGLEPPREVEAAGAHYVALRLTGTVPDRYPRRTGVPTKRPLF